MRIECPECGEQLEVPADYPSRPFCSARCKMLDLGRWFNEEYRIPVEGEDALEPAASKVPEA